MNVIELNKRCQIGKKYIENYGKDVDKSVMWNDILSKRTNYPNYKDFITFSDKDFTAGIGNHEWNTEIENKNYHARIISLVKAYGVPDNFIELIKEPIFGNPRFYNIDEDTIFSANYLRNIVNAYNIYKEYNGKKKLKLLEIGAGSGVLGSILHQILDIEYYVIIDLPENLYLSSIYLQTILDKETTYITDKKQDNYTHIISSLPEYIHNINIPDGIDLVINTNSFGEMPLSTVKAYIEFSKNILKEDGLIYSHNRIHTEDNNSGPVRMSDYVTDNLYIKSLDSSPVNTYFDYHLHHVIFLAKGKSKVSNKIIDIIGEIIHCGLYVYIEDTYNKLIINESNNEDNKFFNDLALFYSQNNINDKLQCLSTMKYTSTNHKIIILFYQIIISFTVGKYNKALYNEFAFLTNNNLNHYSNILIALVSVKSGFIPKQKLLMKFENSNLTNYSDDIINIVNNYYPSTIKGVIKKVISIFKPGYMLARFIRNRFITNINV